MKFLLDFITFAGSDIANILQKFMTPSTPVYISFDMDVSSME